MSDFAPNSLIDLDVCVLNALDLFADPKTVFPRPNLARFKRPLVVGSGNAIATGKIIFDDKDAVLADEGTFQNKLDAVGDIDGVALFSASGGKHAPIIAEAGTRQSSNTVRPWASRGSPSCPAFERP